MNLRYIRPTDVRLYETRGWRFCGTSALPCSAESQQGLLIAYCTPENDEVFRAGQKVTANCGDFTDVVYTLAANGANAINATFYVK